MSKPNSSLSVPSLSEGSGLGNGFGDEGGWLGEPSAMASRYALRKASTAGSGPLSSSLERYESIDQSEPGDEVRESLVWSLWLSLVLIRLAFGSPSDSASGLSNLFRLLNSPGAIGSDSSEGAEGM